MSVQLSISGALPSKRCPEVNTRIISLTLHRVITIGILSTHTLNFYCYPWTNQLLNNTHISPMDMILDNTPGENYFDTRALADFISVCHLKCQHQSYEHGPIYSICCIFTYVNVVSFVKLEFQIMNMIFFVHWQHNIFIL